MCSIILRFVACLYGGKYELKGVDALHSKIPPIEKIKSLITCHYSSLNHVYVGYFEGY